jgi:hypothetical protein
VGLGTTALGWVLCAVLLGTAAIWLSYVRPWRSGAAPSSSTVHPENQKIEATRIE